MGVSCITLFVLVGVGLNSYKTEPMFSGCWVLPGWQSYYDSLNTEKKAQIWHKMQEIRMEIGWYGRRLRYDKEMLKASAKVGDEKQNSLSTLFNKNVEEGNQRLNRLQKSLKEQKQLMSKTYEELINIWNKKPLNLTRNNQIVFDLFTPKDTAIFFARSGLLLSRVVLINGVYHKLNKKAYLENIDEKEQIYKATISFIEEGKKGNVNKNIQYYIFESQKKRVKTKLYIKQLKVSKSQKECELPNNDIPPF